MTLTEQSSAWFENFLQQLAKLFVVLFALILSMCGCGAGAPESEMVSIPSGSSSSSDKIFAETSRITEEEAIEIASKFWGIKSGDVDEETGFTYFIVPVISSNDNIEIALKWLVENQHYSCVDSIEIDPYTSEIVNRDTEK